MGLNKTLNISVAFVLLCACVCVVTQLLQPSQQKLLFKRQRHVSWITQAITAERGQQEREREREIGL